MNLQQQEQFYQVMSRPKKFYSTFFPEARVTEMVKGLLVSKPVEKEPVVIDLQDMLGLVNILLLYFYP